LLARPKSHNAARACRVCGGGQELIPYLSFRDSVAGAARACRVCGGAAAAGRVTTSQQLFFNLMARAGMHSFVTQSVQDVESDGETERVCQVPVRDAPPQAPPCREVRAASEVQVQVGVSASSP